ncbi:MAG TPA: patatin-like phospholipase family protein, partial [Acidimicrobiales bacterium]
MPDAPLTGPTAFVLAGGGTKGSFEAGALQYLVGMERIIPDIITATSAGAIAAAVLAQARTHDEFSRCVQEIENDILAMTRTEHVFGQQPWLRALEGTSLGGAISFALTEGTRPPTPSFSTEEEDVAELAAPSSERALKRDARKLRRSRQRKTLR